MSSSRLQGFAFVMSGALLITMISSTVGCGLFRGADETRPYATEFYHRYLPTARDVPHPDVRDTESPEQSLRDLRSQWSVNHVQRYGRRDYAPSGFSSSATLLSRDLSARLSDLALGVSDLSPDLQARARAEQAERYEQMLAFEVHVFVPATGAYSVIDTHLGSAGMTVLLQDEERNEYRATRVEPGLPEQHSMMTTQPPVYYRSNRIFFERYQNDRDILDGVEQLRLIVRTSGVSPDELWFTWRIRTDA